MTATGRANGWAWGRTAAWTCGRPAEGGAGAARADGWTACPPCRANAAWTCGAATTGLPRAFSLSPAAMVKLYRMRSSERIHAEPCGAGAVLLRGHCRGIFPESGSLASQLLKAVPDDFQRRKTMISKVLRTTFVLVG